MKLFLIFLLSLPALGQHRIGTALQRGQGTAANIVPFANVRVCSAGSSGTPCSPLATIYSDAAMTQVINQVSVFVVADQNGNYSYYAASGCYDEQLSVPGTAAQTFRNVCIGGNPTAVTLIVSQPNSTTSYMTINTSFTKITFSTVMADSAAGFNTSTNLYTIPVSGTYLIVTKMRVQDASTAGINYGQAADTTAADAPWVSWYVTAVTRNGSVNTRIAHFNAGTTIQMYAYADTALPLAGAEMDITLLSTP